MKRRVVGLVIGVVAVLTMAVVGTDADLEMGGTAWAMAEGAAVAEEPMGFALVAAVTEEADDRGGLFQARGARRGAGREAIERLANALDMEPRELVRALRDGSTLEALAAQQGVSLDELADSVTAPRRERLDALLGEGALNQAQVDFLNARADERVEPFLTLPFRRALHEPQLEALAGSLGMSTDDLAAAVAAGQTPAEVIEAQGRTITEVSAELVALKDGKLSELVALDLMTETQKGVALGRYEEALGARLSGEVPERPFLSRFRR